jgi:hypothetical protein
VSNTVTVATNVPQGFVLELGLELDYAACRFVKTPAYKRVVLNGSQTSRVLLARQLDPKDPNGPKAMRGLAPGLTEVDREFITEWLRQHPKMAPHVWIVENPKADLKHQVGDRAPAPFEPMDPATPFRFGGDHVETADFQPK